MLIEQLLNPFFILLLLVLLTGFAYVIKHAEYVPGFIFFVFASLGAVLEITNIGQIGLLKAILLFFLIGVLHSKNMKNGTSVPLPGLILFLAYFISVYLSGTINNIPFADYRSEIGLLVMAVVISMSPNNKETLRMLTIAIMLWGLINAFVVITAKLGMSWGPIVLFNDGGRAMGLTRHSTFMGAYFSIALIAAQILYIQARLKFTKYLLFAFGLLIMLGLLATIARGAFIGWLAGFLFVQHRMQGMKAGSIIGILAVAIIGVAVASMLGLDQLLIDRFSSMEEDSSAQARIPLLLSSLATFSESPVFGTGIGWKDVTMQLQSHNTFMQVLVEEGMIGFILFMTILWRGGWSLLVRSNSSVVSKQGMEPELEIMDVHNKIVSSGVTLRQPQIKLLSQQASSDSLSYYTGLVAMMGAILLNSITHSFDFFMPLWVLIGVGFMRESK